MALKTFRGTNMAEALANVKRELGRDAVIVHTRSVKVGGVLGLGAQTMVEIAAQETDAAEVRIPRRQRTATSGEEFTPASFPQLDEVAPAAAPIAAPAPVPATPSRDSVPPKKPVTPSTSPLSTPVRPAPVDSAARVALEGEIASIKRMVGQLMQASRSASLGAGASVLACGGLPDDLMELYSTILDRGISPEVADLVIGRTRDELGTSSANVRATAARVLASIIAHDPGLPDLRQHAASGPHVIAFVGPTGVGKTTTIAKLAARLKLHEGQRVGLITADTYRIAAVEQLRTYATIIGLPLRVVLSPEEVPGACDSLRDCDCILLDTAGRSHHDTRRVEDTRLIIDAARPSVTHLVLSASSSEAVQRRVLEGFLPLGYDRLIFSKLDEAEHPGTMINSAVRAGKPVSFVAVGQEVPDDLEPARPELLAAMVLEGIDPEGLRAMLGASRAAAIRERGGR
jgi:flagellar biosynthesis protein FlhF